MNLRNSTLAAILAGTCVVTAHAQTITQQPQTQETPNAATQQSPNLQTELNLTPDQIQKWRALNRELREQEFTGTQRVREARRALSDAMEAQSPNEDVIKQRAKELADAQSAMTQLQALRQARVLQILTPEQRVKLREIRERNQALRRSQQGGNALKQERLKRPNASLMTPAQRRAVRRQQKP